MQCGTQCVAQINAEVFRRDFKHKTYFVNKIVLVSSIQFDGGTGFPMNSKYLRATRMHARDAQETKMFIISVLTRS